MMKSQEQAGVELREKKCNKKKQLHPESRIWMLSLEQEITYTSKNGQDLNLQIIYPTYNSIKEDELSASQEKVKANKKHRFPLVVYIQGSACKEQNRLMNLPNLSRFSDRGYVTAMVEQRSSDAAAFPAQIQDVKLAIEYLYQNAKRYNIDTDNIFLWGDSSGAHTAMMAALTRGISDFTDTGCIEYPIRGIIDFYGPTNLASSAKASVTTYISRERKVPPMLILHGTKDRTVPYEQSNILYELVNSTGHSACLYTIEGADHGGYEFWCDEALDLIEDFMDSCIR